MPRVLTRESIVNKIQVLREKEERFRKRADELAAEVASLKEKVAEIDSRILYEAMKKNNISLDKMLAIIDESRKKEKK
ncbi:MULTISPECIES: hypothetical protein [unclassified Anaerobiospirillum]|uniref:hypothetical protein n=1 Tax=unclassified Anaerobiospirillum TaxID=2647410 RepID=UPI001FF29A91|nr:MULTISPECIES: hypothetical protein [unclassified Anaerobiospirillum]MCK0526095.1 hypothetical protein [Anaerobiospirillum sp. NML120449]MCK0534877.1 hypothetical protein [Anaerobiospirillum sp. NML120511]MCK0540060.1 hypothetical protein [Anaerobiospirillum sp. NML02-A-032]